MAYGNQHRRTLPTLDREYASVWGKREYRDVLRFLPHNRQLRRATVDDTSHNHVLLGRLDAERIRQLGLTFHHHDRALFDLVE